MSADFFFFLLGASPAHPMRWGEAVGGRLVRSGAATGAGDLAEAAQIARRAATVIALLPGEQVACRRLPSAPRGGAKLRAAAAYLMEDELGEPAEALLVGAAGGAGGAVAFAAKASVVAAWTEAFAAAGVDCDILSADYLALPSTTEEATLVACDGRVIAAFAGVGLALEGDLFARVAQQLFEPAPAVFRLLGEEDLRERLPQSSAIDWLGPAGSTRVMEKFAASLAAATPPNFHRTRAFKRKAVEAAVAPWRRAAALAAGLAALAFLSFILDAAKFGRTAARWTDAARATHARAFPEAAAEDPVAFARGRLGERGGQASFLLLSSRFAAALEGEGGVEIDRVRYNAARGEFIVSVRSATDGAIEALKAKLDKAGVVAMDSGGFRKNGAFWVGDLSASMP